MSDNKGSMEGFRNTPRPRSESQDLGPMTEKDAEDELEELLQDPSNAFLHKIEKHRVYMDNATAQEALFYAKHMIEARAERTFHYVKGHVDDVVLEDVSHKAILRTIENILRYAREIGRGGDGYVVIDKSEIRNLPPEICYKFAIEEKTARGRNDPFAEMQMQDSFYSAMQSDPGSKIGIPMPFYAVEIGDKKVIAMEKLNAASVDDIVRHKGVLPEWVDIDELCDELKRSIDLLHSHDLYHRDMHFGNVMISQSPRADKSEKMAYIIDFGLSAIAIGGMEPYKREIAGNTFTYDDDYAIIERVRAELKALRERRV